MGSKLIVRKPRPLPAAALALSFIGVPATGALALGSTRSAPSTGGASASANPQASATRTATFRVRARSISALSSQRVQIRGKLLPGVPGRRVRLLGRTGRSWHALASARTRPDGRFDVSYAPAATGRQWLRVRFEGDRRGTGASAYAGRVTVFDTSGASWYDDAGGTACGFHAHFGVAHKTLPCGTHVSFRYGGRSVTAVVDDRGPFVAGRDWDLNQNTAAALGFTGVDTVWWSRS